MFDLLERLKTGIKEIVGSRAFITAVVFCLLSAVLVQRVFYLQIVKGQDYADRYEIQIQKTKEVEGTRGNIFDRNGRLLAFNELAYSVTIEDNGEYDSTEEKNQVLNEVVSTVIEMVESNGDTVISDFGIILDNNNNYMFVAENDVQRLRFVADVFGESYTDDLTKEQKSQSAAQIIHYLCTDEIYGYGLDQEKLSKEEILKLVNVRYAMSLNSYQKYISTTIAEDVSDETVADVMENMDVLQGVSIEEESLRRYNDSECFANIIGYTGQISLEEYNKLSKEDKKKYEKTDTIGKSGIEQVMDSTLKGKKGRVKLYVNSVGKIIETVPQADPVAGGDVYLSIDAGLQKVIYHVIEQELAGILLAKIQNTLDFDRTNMEDGNDAIIPIGDVYNSFISNEILDMNHFTEDTAKATEKEVAQAFASYKKKKQKTIAKVLNNPKAAVYKEQSREMQAYMLYIVDELLVREGVLLSDAIDTGDKTYQAWTKKESINIYQYLNYAISQNWIDTSKLQNHVSEGEKYTDSEELYEGLSAFITDCMNEDNAFDKLLYRYMIRSGSLTGRQICLMLYEQKVLPKDNDQYEALMSGRMGAYDFLREKIRKLEITPGQLALEPCTGSMVVTDTKSGQVLACVSYPGYDNNRLANTMDSAYYNRLVNDGARPFYNSATQEKTAPGSTYKPLVAAAALTEGIITLDEYLPCHGIYEKVEPNPKCWIYPNAHGSLNVEGAIENSCNNFFYEVGYRLSLEEKGISKISEDNLEGKTTAAYYDSKKGTDAIGKYAKMFGFDSTSGIEVPEAEPQISDEASVPSAIGQGTNNYTISQLARYVTAVANKGTVYDLSLLDKTTDVEGKTLKEFKPKVKNTIDAVSSSVWTAIHNGMRNVVTVANAATFSDINSTEVTLSGKTGTAQQSKTHSDHALFVGYAPSDNPEIAFATRIANGYSSVYTCEITRDVMKYYYKLASEKEVVTGKAAKISTSETHGD
ncbi:penicillin-binding transpeptidase domain-containing protein [Lachnospiraceae bacterium 48-42]